MNFRRTTSGQIAKYLFFRQPVLWVEGATDIVFYSKALRRVDFRIEVAGGRGECLRLAAALEEGDLPFVVVLDGDYEMLWRRRSTHRRVVWLNRYSIENYLFEELATESVCALLSGDPNTEVVSRFRSVRLAIETDLAELVLLDVGSSLGGNFEPSFPEHADEILLGNRGVRLNAGRIAYWVRKVADQVTEAARTKAAEGIGGFIQDGRLVDIVRGKVVLGILRRLIWEVVQAKRGRRPQIDNDGLRLILSQAVWESSLSVDHMRLKARLLRALSDARNRRLAEIGRNPWTE